MTLDSIGVSQLFGIFDKDRGSIHPRVPGSVGMYVNTNSCPGATDRTLASRPACGTPVGE